MRKLPGLTAMLLMLALCASACDIVGDVLRSRGSESAPSTNRADIVERLLPEEGLTRKRLRSVIEATMRVTNRPRNDFPERVIPVKGVLRELSLKELQDIERILPDVEANPKLDWND